MVLILAVGVGTFLISTLYFSKDILLTKTSFEANAQTPNLILLDVQAEQQEAIAALITNKKLAVLSDIPIVTMRVQRIKNRSVNAIRLDTTSTINRWILNHEFRVTYRDSIIASEKLEQGQWVGQVSKADIVPISISDNIARDAEVTLNDTLTFNVSGMVMQTRVASIRKVDWGRPQLNFSIVFPTGVLESAPQFRVLTTRTPDEATSADLQRSLVAQFPTVSILDLRQLLTIVDQILAKISWIINFMAFFSILTGIIVLIGAVRTSKYQRIKESVLLRTLGAKSKQIQKITALEYGFLGFLGSTIGVLLSLLGSQLLAYFVFETAFIPSWVPFVVVIPGISLLVVLVGMLNSRSVLRSPPLEVLRREGI